jgi:hypothetical protein
VILGRTFMASTALGQTLTSIFGVGGGFQVTSSPNLRLRIEQRLTYLGYGRDGGTIGEMIETRAHIAHGSVVISRHGLVVLGDEGRPVYYRSGGDGGSIEVQRIPERVLVTVPNGQRLARPCSAIDFIYEDPLIVQEWLGLLGCLSQENVGPSAQRRFFLVGQLTALGYSFRAIGEGPHVFATSLGQTWELGEDLRPKSTRIHLKAVSEIVECHAQQFDGSTRFSGCSNGVAN